MDPSLKYLLYEHTVQSPKWQVDYLPQFHLWLTGREPLKLREDFCGSGRIATEWVRKSSKHLATGIDLDPEPLAYAEKVNRASLPAKGRKRLTLLKQDVLKPTRDRFDMIGAFNFSFCDFHERKTLLKYARSALKSLDKKGTLFMELGGGAGFLEPLSEPKTVKVPGVGRVEQIWEQHQFDPITAVNDYSIHFKLPGGEVVADAFTYHWRVWTIREVREILEEAGFSKTTVLWESPSKRGRESGEFLPTENAENLHSWIAYVIGVK